MHDEMLFSNLEKEFSTVLLHARQSIVRRAKAIHPDLQVPGFRILALLMTDDSQQQGALADRLQLDKATISRLVRHLEALGLITRSSDPTDGRAQLVTLTKKARDGWKASALDVRQKLRSHLEDWQRDDLVRFTNLMHKLNTSLETID